MNNWIVLTWYFGTWYFKKKKYKSGHNFCQRLDLKSILMAIEIWLDNTATPTHQQSQTFWEIPGNLGNIFSVCSRLKLGMNNRFQDLARSLQAGHFDLTNQKLIMMCTKF